MPTREQRGQQSSTDADPPGDQDRAERENGQGGRGDFPVVADEEVPPEPSEGADERHEPSAATAVWAAAAVGRGPATCGSARTSTRERRSQPASSTSRATSPPGHSRLAPPVAEHAEALDRPERPERREQQADDVLEGVLRHRRQRPVRDHARQRHDHRRREGADGRQGHVVGVQPERDDDEHDLGPLEEDALEGDDEGEPVEAEATCVAGSPGRVRLLAELQLLVVDRHQAGRAKDRLPQPLEAEDQ